jgi:hypothetical protein
MVNNALQAGVPGTAGMGCLRLPNSAIPNTEEEFVNL